MPPSDHQQKDLVCQYGRRGASGEAGSIRGYRDGIQVGAAVACLLMT